MIFSSQEKRKKALTDCANSIDMDYAGVSTGAYEPPKSVWELFEEPATKL